MGMGSGKGTDTAMGANGKDTLSGNFLNYFFLFHIFNQDSYTQCAEEKSNESVEDMDRTFAGW